MTRLVAALTLVLSVACAGYTPMPRLVRQQGDHDCTIAALAMVAHRPYDAVARQATALGLGGAIAGTGLTPGSVARVADALHLRLSVPGAPDFEHDEGLLILQFPNGDVHATFLYRGWVYDPQDEEPFPWQQVRPYMASFLKRER